MTQQVINVGTAPNSGDGDPDRTAWQKTNANFTELYGIAGIATSVSVGLTSVVGGTSGRVLANNSGLLSDLLLALVATSGSASDLSTGLLPAARLPSPSPSTLGGVKSASAGAAQVQTGVDPSGNPLFSSLPTPTASTLGGIQSYAGSAHQWINSISTAGVPSSTQPSFSDISSAATPAQLPPVALGIARAQIASYDLTPYTRFLTSDGAPWIKGTGSGDPYAIQDSSGQWWRLDLSGGIINPVWFGADPTGTIDSTSSIQTAINLSATYGTVYFPAGTYKVNTSGTSLTLPNNTKICGAGMPMTTLQTAHASADIFTCSGNNITITDLKISSSVTRSGGNFVNITGTGQSFTFERLKLVGMYNNFTFAGGSEFTVDTVWINGVVSGGTGFYINGSSDVYVTKVVMGAPADVNNQPRAGIEIVDAGGIEFYACDFIKTGIGLLVDPASGHNVTWLFFTGVQFDTCSGDEIYINPASGGKVWSAFFVNCWSSSSVGGEGIHHGSTGTIDTVFYIGHRSQNNNKNGAKLEGGVNALFADCLISGNSGAGAGIYDGINISANVRNFFVDGGIIGQTLAYGNTQGFAVNIASGTSDNYAVRNCNMPSNVTGSINDGGSGVNKLFTNNLPLNANLRQWFTVGQSAASGNSTTSASPVALATVAIPPLLANSQIRVVCKMSFTSNANNKNVYVNYGGTAFASPIFTGTGETCAEFQVLIQNRGATNSQIGERDSLGANQMGWGNSSAAFSTGSVNSSISQNLVIQANTNGSDTATLESYIVEVCNA